MSDERYFSSESRKFNSSRKNVEKSVITINDNKDRSSLPEVFCKKCVLENFAKFTEKHQCHSLLILFFNKKTLAQVFVNLAKIFSYRTLSLAASSKRHLTHTKDLLAMIKKRLISMKKQ